MTNPQKELLELLHAEFAETQRRHPAFSLRAFARKLNLQPSTLSDIFNGKRRITRRSAAKILNWLTLDPAQALHLRNAFQKKNLKTQTLSREFQQLTTDQFHVVANWHSFAIRSLSETEGYSDAPEWIAQRLGISLQDAQQSLARMERLGIMEYRGGKLVSTENAVTTSHELFNRSLQKCHSQNIQLAQEALDHVSLEKRDITGITMAIDPEKIPEAKRRIQKFRRELCAFLESEKKTEVYRLNIQLFPLTQETS